MIKRLSTIMTKGKEWIFSHPIARYGWYLLALLGLLLFWLFFAGEEVAFVYNAF